MTRTTPKKFVSNCAFISSIDKSSRDPKSPYPALFTNTSILLFSATILSIASLTDLSSLTSSWNNLQRQVFRIGYFCYAFGFSKVTHRGVRMKSTPG